MKALFKKIFQNKNISSDKDLKFLDLKNNKGVNKIFGAINNYNETSEIRYVGGCVRKILNDEKTESIVMIGEIGGTAEEEAAEFIKNHKIKKPMVGFVAGITAPPGRRMGHAGAIISGGKGNADEKIKIMEKSGITMAKSPSEIGITLLNKLSN